VYAEWSDIREYVPEEYRDEADLRSTATNLQQGCEDEIEDSLRSRWSMPVTLAANPKAYATVKDLCAVAGQRRPRGTRDVVCRPDDCGRAPGPR